MLESEDDTTPESEHPEHDHEHGEHRHEHTAGEDVLKTQRGCGDKCAKCLVCTRRTQKGE